MLPFNNDNDDCIRQRVYSTFLKTVSGLKDVPKNGFFISDRQPSSTLKIGGVCPLTDTIFIIILSTGKHCLFPI